MTKRKQTQYTVLSPAGETYPARLAARNKESYRLTYTSPDATGQPVKRTVTFFDKYTADGRFTDGGFTTSQSPYQNSPVHTLLIDGVAVQPDVKAKFDTIKANRLAEDQARQQYRASILSVPELRDRGWTDTAIRKFLPETPDDTRDNPHYSRAGAPMKFWLKRRVHRSEKTKGFLAWKAGVEDRRIAAMSAADTRAASMASEMESAEITIQRGWTDEQIQLLAARTHGGNYRGDPGEFRWSRGTARACIRHNLTNYERLWGRINRGLTGAKGYDVLRRRVDALIDEAYPQFCEDVGQPDEITVVELPVEMREERE